MTVQVTSTYTRFAGNGVTTVVNFAFKVFNASDLVVRDILDSSGVPTTLTLTTHYSVAISATGEGGTVTFVTPLASGHTGDIRSLIPLTQDEDIRNQGRFLPEIHEGVFDKLERQNQDTRRLVSQAIQAPDYEANPPNLTLPNAVQRALNFVAFDVNGNVVVSSGTGGGDAALRNDLANTTTVGKGTDMVSIRRTDPEIAALVTPVNFSIQPYDVRRQDAKGDGATNDGTAFANEFSAAAGREVTAKALNGTYRFSGSLATTGSFSIRGEGSSGGRVKACLEFSASPGAATAQWNFTGATAYPHIKNMQVRHAVEPPVDTSHGIGLSFADAPYGRLDNMWVSGFDKGIKVTGQWFYGSMRDVICSGNYTAGMELSGSLWNGTPIFGGQFSRTVAGYGLDIQSAGSHAALYSTYRESNFSTGLHVGGAHTIIDIAPYSENNGSAGVAADDVYLDITFPHWTAKYSLIGGYFDSATFAGKPRIRSTLTGHCTINSKFFNEAATAALQVSDSGGFARGYEGSVHIGSEYAGPYLTDRGAAEDVVAAFFDSKHPRLGFAVGGPTNCNAHLGHIWVNKDAATSVGLWGYKCISPGRLATIPAIATLGSTVNGSKIISINVSNNTELVTGEYIKVAGVTFAGTAFAQILECKSNATIVVDKNADNTVNNAAMSYQPGVLQAIFTDGISGDNGDNSSTLTVGNSLQTQLWKTNLTANRTVTLSTSGAINNAKFRIVRTGLGAFTLDVGGLKTIPAATAAWVEVMYSTAFAAWQLVGYGTL